MFNLENIESLLDLIWQYGVSEIVEWEAEKLGFKLLDFGESKAVFDIHGHKDKVLKILFKENNMLKYELENYKCAPHIFPKIYTYDKRSIPLWIIVEKINKTYLQAKDFNKEVYDYFGLDPKKLDNLKEGDGFLSYFSFSQSPSALFGMITFYSEFKQHENELPDTAKIYKYVLSSQKFKEFIKELNKCKTGLNDLHVGNLGFNNKGNLIILDSPDDRREIQIEGLIFEDKDYESNKINDLVEETMLSNGITASLISRFSKLGFVYEASGRYKSVFRSKKDINKLLKIYHDNAGIVENQFQNEIDNYKCSPEFFPIVYDYDQINTKPIWIIVEHIPYTYETIKPDLNKKALEYFEIDIDKLNQLNSIEKYYKYNFIGIGQIFDFIQMFREYKKYYMMQYVKTKELYKYIFSRPNILKFIKTINQCKAGINDLHISNIGFRKNGEFVIIDSPSIREEIDINLEGLIYE
jgi:hypothetical protein